MCDECTLIFTDDGLEIHAIDNTRSMLTTSTLNRSSFITDIVSYACTFDPELLYIPRKFASMSVKLLPTNQLQWSFDLMTITIPVKPLTDDQGEVIVTPAHLGKELILHDFKQLLKNFKNCDYVTVTETETDIAFNFSGTIYSFNSPTTDVVGLPLTQQFTTHHMMEILRGIDSETIKVTINPIMILSCGNLKCGIEPISF